MNRPFTRLKALKWTAAKRRATAALTLRLQQLRDGAGPPSHDPVETIAVIERTLHLMAISHRATAGQLKLANDIGIFKCATCAQPATRVNSLIGRCERHRASMRRRAILGLSARDALFDAEHPHARVSNDHSGYGIEYVRGAGVLRAARRAR